MFYMKKRVLFLLVIFISILWIRSGAGLSAQVMVNYGSIIYSANDTIFANGGISNLTDTHNTGIIGGTFRNGGEVYLTGDWTNSAGNTAFTNTNNSSSNTSFTCYMIGGNQNIQGTSVTEFHNLELRGTGVKQLFGTNAIVKDTLNLNDRELATNTYTMFVTSPAIPSIQRTSGFVSSLNTGFLQRTTTATAPYLFPVGSSTGTFRFRPVEITPENGSVNDYAVRLANVDATAEGSDISIRQPIISNVNPQFYHQIERKSGVASAAIVVYYDPAQDGAYTSMGHWQNLPQWEDITANISSNNYGLSAIRKQSWDFTSPSPAFALISIKHECGDLFVPNAFSPDNDGENDLECVYGKCIQTLFFVIYDRWGEKVFETTDPKQCWDGTYKGKLMNTAVFVYYLKATLDTGEEITKKGNISLLR